MSASNPRPNELGSRGRSSSFAGCLPQSSYKLIRAATPTECHSTWLLESASGPRSDWVRKLITVMIKSVEDSLRRYAWGCSDMEMRCRPVASVGICQNSQSWGLGLKVSPDRQINYLAAHLSLAGGVKSS